MFTLHSIANWLSSIFLVTVITGCTARIPAPTKSSQHLWPCPPLLNCVSTEGFFVYRTPPFILQKADNEHWNTVLDSVEALPRTKITFSNSRYIRARSHSKVFHFPDYLEILYRQDKQALELRSVSVLGVFDFGVNRYRIYQIRKALQTQKIIY